MYSKQRGIKIKMDRKMRSGYCIYASLENVSQLDEKLNRKSKYEK